MVVNPNNNYIVYIHQNKINNKAYIGLTKNSLQERSGAQGYRYQKSPHFYHAIQKYGWDNFEHIIFSEGLSQEQAKHLEFLLIKLFDTTNPIYGYNLKDGGDAPQVNSEKGVIQYSFSGKEIARYPSCTAAAQATGVNGPGRIAEVCNKKRYSANGYVFCYDSSPLTPAEIQEYLAPKLNHSNYGQYNKTAVVEIDLATGQVINYFESQQEAARQTGIRQNTISRDCAKTSITNCFKRKTIFQKAVNYQESPFYKQT